MRSSTRESSKRVIANGNPGTRWAHCQLASFDDISSPTSLVQRHHRDPLGQAAVYELRTTECSRSHESSTTGLSSVTRKAVGCDDDVGPLLAATSATQEAVIDKSWNEPRDAGNVRRNVRPMRPASVLSFVNWKSSREKSQREHSCSNFTSLEYVKYV